MEFIDPRHAGTGESAAQAAPEGGAPATVATEPAPAAPPAAATADVLFGEGTAPGVAAGIDRQAALRALRNLEATEARLERNARREIEETRGKLVKELLPVLDNLDRTIRAAHTGRSDPAMLEGVRLVRQQLEGVLRGFGVERIESLGQRFDPAIHEAISMVPVNDPRRDGVVMHEIEPGYRFAGRLLRATRVAVGKLASPFDVRPASMWR